MEERESEWARLMKERELWEDWELANCMVGDEGETGLGGDGLRVSEG